MNTPPVDLIVERAVRAGTSSGGGAVQELIEIAQRRRAPLEAAHAVLVARLHRRPDDFDATRALQLVIRALQQVGHALSVAKAPGRHGKQRRGDGSELELGAGGATAVDRSAVSGWE
jgi:hypothetical protein